MLQGTVFWKIYWSGLSLWTPNISNMWRKCHGQKVYGNIHIWKGSNWLRFKAHNTPRILFSWGSFWNIEMIDIVDAAKHNLLRKWSESFALACNREWRSTALCRCERVLSVLNSNSALFSHHRVSLREFKFVLIKTDEISNTNKKHVFCSCKESMWKIYTTRPP